jgi:serine/threonine protein phosphatase PrpC
MEKYLPVPAGLLELGVVSLPDDHYEVNGDGYFIREFGGDKVLLAVIDGLGQGSNAYQSSLLVRQVIEANHYLPLDSILYKCETALREKGGNFGAAIGLLLIKPHSFHYAAVGDTFMRILTGKSSQLISQPGIVGPFRMPVVKVIKRTCKRENMVVALCTDGIKDHFSGSDLPIDADVHSIADDIIGRYRREYGDATVMVIRFNIP